MTSEAQRKRVENSNRMIARKMLDQWAREMKQGQGAPNVLALFDRVGGGDPFWHVSPGPIFSPMAERADQILRDVRLIDPQMATLLICSALEISEQKIAVARGITRLKVRNDLEEGFGAFVMGMYYRGTVLRQWVKRPRRMIPGDIGV